MEELRRGVEDLPLGVRRTLAALFAITAVAALAGMAYGQYRIRLDPEDTRATVQFLIAAVVAALMLGWRTEPAEGLSVASPGRSRAIHLLGGIGVILGLFAVGAGSYLLTRSWAAWFFHGWALFFAGTTLLSVAIHCFDPRRDRSRAWTRGEVVALLAIIGLGTFLRFYRYGEFPDPFGMHAIEEPQVGTRSYALLKDHIHGWEFLFDNYLGATGIWLFGDRSFTAIRFPYTVVSVLTIVPAYVLLRQLVSSAAALGATFLFAVSSWNIIYSRCAHAVFPTNFLVVIVLALMLHFARSGRLAGLPWAGLLSGYTLYSYAAYRGTPLFALVLLIMCLARDLRRWRIADTLAKRLAARAAVRDLCAVGILVTMVAALFVPVIVMTTSNQAQPMYYFEAANRSLSNKEYYTSDWRAFIQQRVQRARNAARVFMHFGDGSTTFNAPGEPMLDPLTATLFVGGLSLAACYPRRNFHAFLVFMFLGLMFGGTIFVQNLDVRRLQGVTPFVAIFAALFLDRLWLQVRQLPRLLVGIMIPLLVGAGAIFATYWNYDVYFRKMAGDPHVRQTFTNQYTILIHYGRLHPDRELLVLCDMHHFFEPSDFFWMIDGLIHGRTLWDVNEILPPHELPKSPLPQTIVIQNPYERHAVARLLMDVYPGMACSEFVEPDYPYITLTTCEVPPGVVRRPLVTTLTGRYWRGNEPVGPPDEVRQEPFIAYATIPSVCRREQPQAPDSCYAEWSGTLEIPPDGDYVLVARTHESAQFAVSLDGGPLTTERVRLGAGSHQVIAQARIPRRSGSGVSLEWQRSGEPIPLYYGDPLPFYHFDRSAEIPPSTEDR